MSHRSEIETAIKSIRQKQDLEIQKAIDDIERREAN
jgi:hypothetical protein